MDNVFHRNLNHSYPVIKRGEGVYLYDQDEKRYLDGAAGALSVSLGYSNVEVIQAITEQAGKVPFVHTMRFETDILHQCSSQIARWAPDNLNKVYLTSGGAEAVESAIKLARQYHSIKGNDTKYKVIGRWQGYHGNTLGALSAGGDIKRRKLYAKQLPDFEHVHPPYCRQCPYGKEYEKCKNEGLSCVQDLEEKILEAGPENIAAFIAEPIIGSQIAALVPPDEYWSEVKEVCERHDILLIADEVMTGFARTGEAFAADHWDFKPDIITFGKGISSSYIPLGGIIVSDQIISAIHEESDGVFLHGYTFSGHPLAAAAGSAVLSYMEANNLVEEVRDKGYYMETRLNDLKKDISIIGDIRGKGLMWGMEIVKDQKTNEPFPPFEKMAYKIYEHAMEEGVIFYPGSGAIRGERGDHLLIGPPLTITIEEIDQMISILENVLRRFSERNRDSGRDGQESGMQPT